MDNDIKDKIMEDLICIFLKLNKELHLERYRGLYQEHMDNLFNESVEHFYKLYLRGQVLVNTSPFKDIKEAQKTRDRIKLEKAEKDKNELEYFRIHGRKIL